MILKHSVFTTLAMLATLVLFQETALDFQVQDFLYDHTVQRWFLQKNEAVTHFIFYSGIKAVLIIIFVVLIAALFLSHRWNLTAQQRLGLRIAILGMIVVPLAVNLLKDHTNMACPKNLTRYGGEVEYIHLFARYTDINRPATDNRCFPSGHASGGFSLLALTFLMRERKHKQALISVAVLTGWVMGFYKMLIGDHFLSHILVSMELSWLLVCLTALIVQRIRPVADLSHHPVKQ